MYDIQFLATTSADWAESIELIDATANMPIVGIDDATFELSVDDRCGHSILTRSSADGTIIRPEPYIVQWVFPVTQMSGVCRSTTYRVGLTMTTAGGVTQIILGSLALVDGIVSP